ncbi:unnamed protein product [Rhizoctonia solani]|uniref:Uncharacterized protein n=1 Tax=Rhizoctonia solani TaxID=456999 RepID=A0A8H3C5D9_9AGAM|nr:unnamed protein product [Rhizoctonia solani]
MLRWGRWVVVHVVGSRLGVSSGKNVSRIGDGPVLGLRNGMVQTWYPPRQGGCGWVRRPFSLASSRRTNENTGITIARPSPNDPLKTLRELLDKRPVDLGALESAYVASTHSLSYLTKSEFSSLVSCASARPEFVLKICADQTALGRRIPDTDRYRYMLAHLACCLRSLESNCDTLPEALPAPIEHLAHAQGHYAKLAKNQSGVHRTYLEYLLRMYQHASHSEFLGVVRGRISNVLKSLLSRPRFRFDTRLSEIIWRVIASVRFDVPQTKSILHLLRLRLSSGISSSDSGTLLDPIETLRQTILDFPSADARVNQEARSILHDARAWEWLRALAGSHEPVSMTGADRLNVLASLRQLEHGSEPSVASLERCWDLWMTVLGAEAASAHSTPVMVDRAVLLAFLRLAARFQSIRVVSGSERLLTVYTSVVHTGDAIHMAWHGSLSVQLGAAYACMGTSNVFGLQARLSGAGFRTDSSQLPAGYLTHVVGLLLKYSPRIAWEVASQVSADLPASLVASVAHDCAKVGYLPGAVSLLRDTRLEFEQRHCIALVCLRQLDRQRGVLTRIDGLHVCEALGPDLSRTPLDLRPIAIRMALNTGLVRLAGLMGARWELQPPLQRLLAARLVKAHLPQLAFQVVDKDQTKWLYAVLNNTRYRKHLPASIRRSHNLSYGKINATRLGNKLLICADTRLGGRAQLRATLATLARLLRTSGAAREPSRNKRAPFRPDGVTLNIIVRALVRSTSCVSSSDLRALFDLLSRAGRCGLNATGNHFGTESSFVLSGYASSAIALAKLVPRAEGPWAFVRYVRPLLKTFVFGLRLRGDQEAVKVVTGVLRAEDAHRRKAGWQRAGGPDT